jgi:hypothetical protein
LADALESCLWYTVGMIFGLMLFKNLAPGCVIGAALGLVMGAAIDAHKRR